MAWSMALKAPNGRRVQWMEERLPGVWENDASATIDEWAHRTLLREDWDGWIMYNDEPPEGDGDAPGTCGHCKGVVAWNAEKAGWLIHSVPKWPPAFTERLDGREMMENIGDDQVIFGQSFAWVEVGRAALEGLLAHAALMQPWVYAANDPAGLYKARKAPSAKEEQVAWLELGEGLQHVAKCRQWNACLFQDALVAEKGGPCIAETWCRPRPVPTAEVWNAVVLGWPGSAPLVAYHESQDHSKYAVAASEEKPWTYVGDINNMKSQRKRGGGGLVFASEEVHAAFRGLIHTDDRRGPGPAQG